MSGHADDQLADSVADLHIHDGDGDDYDDDDDEELAIDPHAPVLDVSVDDTTFKFNIDDFKLDDFLASPIVPPPPPAGPIFEVVHVDKPPRQVIRTAQDAPPTVIVNAFTAAAPDARRTGFRQAEMVKLRVLIGLQRLGVRFERVPPGARTSYPHAHKLESELVYCVQGNGVVWQNGYTYPFTQADVASWRAGTGVVHTIINDSNRDDPAAGSDLWLISVSEKKPGESWHYPLSPTRRAEITAAQTWDERDVPEQNELGDHPGFPCVPYGSEERGSASSDYPRPSNGPRPTNICNALERLDDAGKDDMFAHACSLTGETHLTGAEFGCNLEILPPGTRSSGPFPSFSRTCCHVPIHHASRCRCPRT